MLYRILIEAVGDNPQAIKEDLAMALERAGPGRVVEITEVYSQAQMSRSGREWLRDLYQKQKEFTEARGPIFHG